MATKEKEAEVASETNVDETKGEEETQASLEELQTKLAEAEKDLTEARTQAKSHQEYGRKQKEALDRQRGLDEEMAELKSTLKVVVDMQADILDRGEQVEVEKPQERRSDVYKERLKDTQKTASTQANQRYEQLGREADGILRTLGFTMDGSPEAKDAYIMFLSGNPEGGLEEIKRIQREKTEAKPQESVEEKAKKLAEEMHKTFLKDKGWDDLEDSTSSAASVSTTEAMKQFIAGKIDGEEAKKRGVRFD